MQVLCYDAALGPWLLGGVVLCLLGAGPLEAQVTQSPRFLITKTGKKLTVTCSQNMNHDCMYWYRQDPGLGLKLIYFSINVQMVDTGDVSDGYAVSRKEKKNFPLTLESANINQTSLYLCASSFSQHSTDSCSLHKKGQPQKRGASSWETKRKIAPATSDHGSPRHTPASRTLCHC
uniref:Immunoglobulin V-set domain-containing protein n=1 Tax=Sciurus vulgaris TaxID=55149 RepID=A0A8D2CZ51_SCIVU